jgi:Tfp pilus assembly protein PilX
VIRSAKQTGYILLPVIVVITVVAAIALLMNTESALESNTAGSELDAQQAQYVAEAGLNHALWLTQQHGCGPYSNLTDEPFANDKYTTALTTDLGSTTAFTISVDQDSWIRSDLPTENKGTDLKLHTRNEAAGIERPLLRYDLSPIAAKASILSATAWFYITNAHAAGPIDIHLTSADWIETDATWDSMNTNMDSAVLATIPSQPVIGIWIPVNLTAQVQAWVNGQPNFGITLNSTVDGVHGQYNSRESANPPWLEVIIGAPPSSPAQLKADATLDNGVGRSIARSDVVLRQRPGFTLLQPDAAGGKDTYLYEWKPTWNYGVSGDIWADDRFIDSTANGLIRFDLGAVPAGARVTSARLELYQTNTSLSGGPIGVYRVGNSWDEGTRSGQAGISNWAQRDATNTWSSIGGDFDATRYAVQTVPASTGWSSWEIGELVGGWVTGKFPNHGLLLRAETSGAAAHFASSDATDPTLRPKLSITYACACGEVCVAPQGSGNLLMVVVNPTTLVAEDQKAKDLFESWGYTVSVISESANQSTYDSLIALNDVVFISETVNSNSVGTKLVNAPIGVVSQDGDYNPDLGLAPGASLKIGGDIDIVSTDHYITQPFAVGTHRIYTADMEQAIVSGSLTADQQLLAENAGDGSLVVLDRGDAMEGGGTAAGRRVILPLGTRYRFDWDYLNANGRLLVQRALAWGANADKTSKGNVLLVVVNPGSLTVQEDAKKALIEGWDYTVNLIDESDSQANFDALIAANDVAYIPLDITSSNLGTKLRDAAIGVVNEEGEQVDELGISQDKLFKSRHEIDVIDNTHYITQPFATGLLTFTSSDQSVHMLASNQAPGLLTLAESFNTGSIWEPSLAVIETGDDLWGGGTAAGRRVQLPWGGGTFDINQLTDDGRTIMQRALEWGAGAGCASSKPLLLVVGDAATLSGKDAGMKTLMESWCYNVTVIDDGDSQANFDAATAAADVVYVSGTTSGPALLDKLTGSPTPIVNEINGKLDNFGFSSSTASSVTASAFSATNASHYISEPFTSNPVTFFTTDLAMPVPGGTLAPGLQMVGETTGAIPALVTLDTGAQRWDGNPAPARRVHLPFTNAEIAQLTADGETLMQRALEWAGGAGITGPIAHWKLDETSGTTAVDSVGGYDGTLINWPASPDWVPGKLDGGLSFDGSNDYIDVSSMNPLAYDDFTIVAWYKSADTSVSDDEYIFVHDDSFVDEFTFGPTDDAGEGDRLRLGLNRGGTWDPHYGTSDIVDQQWHHLVAVRSGGRIKLYVDGVEETDEVDALAGLTVTIDGDGPFIGDYPGVTEQVHGTLDDVRFYDRGLGATEIGDLFAAGGGGLEGTFLDEFNAIAYNGDDGTLSWSNNWQETGESDGPGSGDFVVLNDSWCASGNCLRIREDRASTRRLSREVDMAGAVSATLSLNYRRRHISSPIGGTITLEISDNGGSSFTPLKVYDMGTQDAVVQSDSFDISGYIASDTQLRFSTSNVLFETALYVDNVLIDTTVGGGGPPGCDDTFRDEFNTVSFGNNDGTLNWEGDWLEVGESDGPNANDVRVRDDNGPYQLWIRDNNNGGEGAEREADLSGASVATLSFDYRRSSLDNANDYVKLEISANGTAGPWTELARFEGAATDSAYQSFSQDITSYISANTRIRLISSPTMGNTDLVIFENVEICIAN